MRAAALALLLGVLPVAAEEPVSVELLLAIDVSSSVDAREFALQTGGIAAAFRDPELVDLISRHPGGIAVAVMPWSAFPAMPGPEDWAHVTGAASAARFAARVEGYQRRLLGSTTAIGGALRGGTEALASNGFAGFRRVIDLSGDGRSNDGIAVALGRDIALAAGITVNGLAVMTDESGLDGYFRRSVIGGPASFAAAVESYDDYPAAIRAKLLRELALMPETSALGNDSVPNL